MKILIFEQDCIHEEKKDAELNEEYAQEWLKSPHDTYTVSVEYEDDKVIILQAIEVDEGESYKFIGVK